MTRNEFTLTGAITAETYKALFRFARDAILIERDDQTIIDANPAAETMFGYSHGELVNMKTENLKKRDLRDEIPHSIYSDPTLDENLTFQTEVVTKDGNEVPVEITITPIPYDDSWIYLSIIRDISLFKSVEEAYKEAQSVLEKQFEARTKELTQANEEIITREQRYRNLVENSLQGIMIVDGPPYFVSFSNPAVTQVLGYSTEELQQLPPDAFRSLIHWADRNRVIFAFTQISKGEIEEVRLESRFHTKSNRVIWLDLSINALPTNNSLLITLIDITQQRQALDDLTDSARDLELYSSLLRHDLKNDLQVIMGNADVIRLSTPDNELVQQVADASIAGAERMLDLLNIFGKPETAKMRSLAPMLEAVSVEAARLYVGMKCMLHIDPEVLKIRVIGGRMLSMVFRNLIGNSAKYSGKDSRVDIRAIRKQNSIEISVSDNGPGIAEEIRSRFFSKGVSTSGGGLGLYLSKKIVEAYGGSLELVNPGDDDSGAVFLVRLAIASS